MSAIILNGKELAAQMETAQAQRVRDLQVGKNTAGFMVKSGIGGKGDSLLLNGSINIHSFYMTFR